MGRGHASSSQPGNPGSPQYSFIYLLIVYFSADEMSNRIYKYQRTRLFHSSFTWSWRGLSPDSNARKSTIKRLNLLPSVIIG